MKWAEGDPNESEDWNYLTRLYSSPVCSELESAVRTVRLYLLVHRTGLVPEAGKQQSPSRAEASLGVGFASFCTDPQQSASGYLTQTHR